jgi:hypothetical protein
MQDAHEVLGVDADADELVIEAAYKALVKEHHPDHGGDEEKFQEVKTAYDSIQNNSVQNDDDESGGFDNFTEGLIGLGTPVKSESIEGRLNDELTIEEWPMKISLLGLFRTDVSNLINDFAEDEVPTDGRYMSLFKIENISEYVQPWKGDSTTYIGDDGQSYSTGDPMNIVIDRTSPFSSQIAMSRQDMEPQTWKLGVVVLEPVPEGTDIDKVVYPHKVFKGNQTDGHVKQKTRYEFSITDKNRMNMLDVIGNELMDEAPKPESIGKLDS